MLMAHLQRQLCKAFLYMRCHVALDTIRFSKCFLVFFVWFGSVLACVGGGKTVTVSKVNKKATERLYRVCCLDNIDLACKGSQENVIVDTQPGNLHTVYHVEYNYSRV